MTEFNNNKSNQNAYSNNTGNTVKHRGKWSTGKLILGIVSILFF